MKFTDPYLLFLLWGLFPLAGILVYGILRHKRILTGFADREMLAHILPGVSYTRRWVKLVLVLAGFALAVTALAGPRYGFRWEKTTQKGVDIMVALDCSRSMLAADVSPTRLERAKREIIDLTRLLRSDRAGLVAFAGRAVLQCPLTLDYNAFGVFLDVLGPDYLPVGGTNLHEALQTSLKGFHPESDTEKAVIVITDGEDTSGPGKDALMDLAREFAKQKIRLFAIGVGDPSGAPIPDAGGGFKKDRAGNIVLSRVDEATLTRLTAATGGRYVRSVAGDMDLEQIYTRDILGTMERTALTQGRKKVWEQRFQWLLLPALVFWLLDFILPGHVPGTSRGRGLLAVLIICFAAAALLPDQAAAGFLSSDVKQGIEAYGNEEFETAKKHFIDAQLDSPEDPRHYYNVGTAAYAAGDYDLAESNFLQAAESGEQGVRRNALFNLANTRYRQGRLDQAAKDYESLLKTFPDDIQAKENLDFVRRKQKEAREKKNQPGGENQPENGQGKEDTREKSPDEAGDRNPEHPNQDQVNQEQQDKDRQNQKPENKGRGKEQDEPGTDSEQKRDGVSGDPLPAPTSRPEDNPGKERRQAPGKAAAADREKGPGSREDAESRMLQNRLNRLTDKPGMALMPGGDPHVEQDW